MALRQLTDLQQKFVKYYLETNDVGQAIRLAGYSPSDAKQRGRLLLRKSHVRAAIAEARKEAGIYAALSLEDILEGLYKEAKFVGKGSSHSARINAWVHIAKILGHYKEQEEQKVMNEDNRVQIQVLQFKDSSKNSKLIPKIEEEKEKKEEVIEEADYQVLNYGTKQ